MSLIRGTQKLTTFLIQHYDTDGSGHAFDQSQDITTPPTKFFAILNPRRLNRGILNHLVYKIVPTAAVTFTLRLWHWNFGTNPTVWLVWQSAGGKVGGTVYEETNLNAPFYLLSAGQFFYSIEWSAAPGVTTGSVEGQGVAFDY
jgi:hypothetical protein